MSEADVLIVGGGPAGAAAALTLRRYTPLSVVLVERGDYSDVRVGETVGPGANPLLEFLGVAGRVEGRGHRRALATSAAWGSEDIHTQDFMFTGRGEGWHLDRGRFDASLAEAVRETGADVRTRTRVREVTRGAGLWRVSVESDSGTAAVSVRFVIDASGRGAVVARRSGATARPVDQLVGVVGYVQFDAGSGKDDGTTLVESVPEGWWYSAWLPGSTLAVAFMSDSDLARPRGALALSGWLGLLSQARHTRDRVVGGRRPPRVFVRAASSHLLRPARGDGWVAAGDALSAFDPLSSMGVGHALASGANAARAVDATLLGDPGPAAGYAARSAEHFCEFLATRSRYYAMETRWPSMPFWRRRHNTPAQPIPPADRTESQRVPRVPEPSR